MNTRNKLQTLVLIVYLPIVLTIGLMHTDGVHFYETGEHAIGQSSLHSYHGHTEDGYCFACNFTAGHYISHTIELQIYFYSVEIRNDDTVVVPTYYSYYKPDRGPPISIA